MGYTTCGSELTGRCVIERLKEVTDYDAGGLQSATDPAANLPGTCAMVVRLRGTRYEQVLPSQTATQACDPSYRVTIE